MFRKWQFYFGANDYVEMTEELDSSMLASLGQRRRRRLLVGMVLVMALFVGFIWMASNPVAFQWLSRVAPPVAQWINPAAGSQEESGIRLDVAGVTREGDELLVHLTMEDLRGDRLSGATYPVHWTYAQDRSDDSGHRTQEFDAQTGLLHLYLRCDPARDMPEFDWERWVTVNIYGLRTPGNVTEAQISIPLTLTDCTQLEHIVVSGKGRLLEHLTAPVASIQEGRDITCMTVIEEELHVQVRTDWQTAVQEYVLILFGPHGELIQSRSYDDGDGYTHWVFDLKDRDVSDCTLIARVDPTESIEGTWTIQVSPVTEE